MVKVFSKGLRYGKYGFSGCCFFGISVSMKKSFFYVEMASRNGLGIS